MPESAARRHLRETREQAAAEREAAEAQRPSMFQAAVEAAAGALPDVPTATVEQVALAVLRVALPLHETQHADAWKAAHERAVHFELESVKAAEHAEAAEKEVQRYRSFCGEALCGDVERERDEYLWQNEQLRGEVQRLRALTGEPEIQWGHQVHADDGHRGDEVPQTNEDAARIAVAYLNTHKLPAGSQAVLIQREVRVHEGPWQVVPACECPHTYQPNGRLVWDGVLAVGCPVHDPDAGGNDEAEAEAL